MSSRLAYAVLVALAACGNDNEPPGVDAIGAEVPDSATGPCADATAHSDLAWIQDNVFTPSCTKSACHDADEPELSLVEGAAYANLVGRASSTQSGWTRVVPGAPSQSYLLVALGREPGPPPEDGFMPLLSEPLCAEKIDAIARWIAGGAQP